MRAPSSIATGQVTINDSTATEIVPQRLSRTKLQINAGYSMTIGGAGVTLADGYVVAPVNGIVEIDTGAAVYAINNVAGTAPVSYIEFYD